MSKYKVEPIGKAFKAKHLKNLEATFSQRYEQGYRFHSVIEVTEVGCMFQQPATTLLAVYERIDD